MNTIFKQHAPKQHASMLDDTDQVVAMNPNLTLEELNTVAEQKIKAANDRPYSDFCGLSPTQMSNWLNFRMATARKRQVGLTDTKYYHVFHAVYVVPICVVKIR